MSIFKSHHTRKLKSEELNGAKLEVPQEDYTCQGKFEIAKRQRVISVFQILFGAGLSICGFYLSSEYPFFGNTALFIIGIMIAVFGCLALYWSIRDTDRIQQKISVDQWYNTQDHSLSKILFTSSIIKTIVLFTLLVTLFIYKHTVHDYFIANSEQGQDKQQIQERYNTYYIIEQITIGIGCANLIIMIFTTFSSYAFSNTAASFRISLYIFNLITLGLCGGLVYVTSSTKYLENIHSLQEIADFWAIRVLFYISAVYILTLLAILITNFVKSMNFYLSIGTLLLLICIILVTFNGKIYRNAKQVSNFAKDNCQNEMQMIHQDYLVKVGCPNKYIFKKDDKSYPSCEMDSQAVYWEKDGDKDNVDKQNSIQCLNIQCCGIAGKVYADWFYLMATIGQLISLFSFVIIGMCYYLSQRYSGNSVFFKKIESIFLVLSILVLTVWVLLIIYYQYQPISQKPGILAQLHIPDQNSDLYRQYQYADVTKRIQCEKSFSQYFYIFYQKQFSKNEIFQCTDDCQKTHIRISVTATYYKIILFPQIYYNKLSESFNDPNVKIFDSRFYSVFNQGEIQPDTDFVGAEGTIQSIKNFFMQNVCLYSYDSQANHNMIVRVSKVNPETGKVIKKVDFKPSKLILKEINQNYHRKDDTNYSQPFDEKREQNLINNISFQSVLITIKDGLTNEDITSKNINLKVYFHHQECIEQNNTPSVELSGIQSQFLVKNLYTNTYTIFVKVDGYNYSCKRVYLTDHFKTSEEIVYMNKNLKNQEMRVVLEWSKHSLAQLNLLATLQTDKSVDCIVGFLNENCQKIYYERKSQHPYYQSIKIDQLGANNYLYYIKHNLSQKSYEDLVASGKKNVNQILAESGAHFSIYVDGLEYPVFESGVGYFDSKYSDEENLVWLVACMNGTYGNQVYSLSQYWSNQSTSDFIIKNKGQELPPAEICSNYFNSMQN